MTAPPEKNNFRQTAWLAAILMTIAAVWLHFYFLFHAGGFWHDEVNLINLAGRHSLGDMAKDSFPVLMPVIVHGWMALGLGHSDLCLRLLGTVIGLGIIAALWIAAGIAHRSPPLVGLTLLGLNSTVINYGDSLRAHGLGSLLIALTSGAMWIFLKRPSWSRAGILTLAAILSVQALYQNAILFAAICFGAWTVCFRRKCFQTGGKILLVACVTAATLLPYWKIIAGLPESSTSLRIGFVPAVVFTNFDTAVAFPLRQYIYVWEFLALTVVVFGFATLFDRNKNPRPTANETSSKDLPLFAGAALLAAVVAFAGFLRYAALMTQSWYFLPLLTLAAVCFDLGLPPVRGFLRAVSFGFLIATALVSVPYAQRDLNCRFTNMDLLAQKLESKVAPDDFIVVVPWPFGISFERYFKGPTPWTTVPPVADHSTHRYDLVKLQMQNTNATQPVLDQIARTLQAGHRVWVVGSINIPATNTPPPASLPPPPLAHSGWIETPYDFTWSAQTACFLGNHARHFETVYQETNNNVSFFESMNLFLASGWKTNQP
jgi:hypothetical protein